MHRTVTTSSPTSLLVCLCLSLFNRFCLLKFVVLLFQLRMALHHRREDVRILVGRKDLDQFFARRLPLHGNSLGLEVVANSNGDGTPVRCGAFGVDAADGVDEVEDAGWGRSGEWGRGRGLVIFGLLRFRRRGGSAHLFPTDLTNERNRAITGSVNLHHAILTRILISSLNRGGQSGPMARVLRR